MKNSIIFMITLFVVIVANWATSNDIGVISTFGVVGVFYYLMFKKD